MSHIEQFKSRLADIKAGFQHKDQFLSLKWAMSQMKATLEADEAGTKAALDKWYADEATTSKPVVADHSAEKTAIDNASGIVDQIVASIDNTNALLDQATAALS